MSPGNGKRNKKKGISIKPKRDDNENDFYVSPSKEYNSPGKRKKM